VFWDNGGTFVELRQGSGDDPGGESDDTPVLPSNSRLVVYGVVKDPSRIYLGTPSKGYWQYWYYLGGESVALYHALVTPARSVRGLYYVTPQGGFRTGINFLGDDDKYAPGGTLASDARVWTFIVRQERDSMIEVSKMHALRELGAQLLGMKQTLGSYRHIFVPSRRTALLRSLTSESTASRFLTYQEVTRAVKRGGKAFAEFLPALAIWIPDDEAGYLDAFSFDEPEYFHRNYIDHERYAFRIIGAVADSLGLVYEVRELSPKEIRSLK
jgi:hypothetical protein